MHIVLANQWYPPESGWGGVAMWNYAMARALRDLGHTVTVIAARTAADVPAWVERDGIAIHRLEVRDHYRLRRAPQAGRYARPIQQLWYARRVDQTLRALNQKRAIDAVEFAEVNAEGFWYARRPEAAVVVRCHTPTFVLRRYYQPAEMPYDTRLISWCERDLIRRAHALTAPSHDTANVIAQECGIAPGRIDVIPNALPLDEFGNAGQLSAAPGNGLTVLHVGRLERVKGVRVLAEAIPRVLRRVPNARFVFVGEDLRTPQGVSQRAALEGELASAVAHGQVVFAGTAALAELLDWYGCADVCVVPTLNYESFSYTCAQAMAAGKPVVASRSGGIPETVEDGVSGILVPPGDGAALADALTELLGDPRMRAAMGAAGRERAIKEFDAGVIARQLVAVYERTRRAFAPDGRTTPRASLP